MTLESLDPNGVTEEEFKNAMETANRITNMSEEHKLQLYGLYKQSTIGNNNINNPPVDMVAKMKWDAWKAFEGYPQKSAANAYVYLVNSLASEDRSDDRDTPGMSGFAQGVSTFQDLIGDTQANGWTTSEELCAAVTSKDLDRVQRCIQSGADINMRTREGMTPLHYAADSGESSIVSLLIEAGADVNTQDVEGETPLSLAVTCEHEEVVRVLLASGGDPSIKNQEGESLLTIEDVPEVFMQMILERQKL
eukprot:CAMPEP_0182434302 /NCGR_PEP_ID=MMETSP1167-20130531/68979_1 /TAXON_ID=2988 /ORGANISM="Mallomonas Sp, Strain CCMP3275" /LENGTH=249 /DNA_ID=CAMNT_0024624009 /DNA_START=140 /DNA_END=889 /DNA_ORIENTATION=-